MFKGFAITFVFCCTSTFAQLNTTATNDTNSKSILDGGAGLTTFSAQAVGNSISTGTGEDRSAPTSPHEYAQLLSGIFFGSLVSLEFSRPSNMNVLCLIHPLLTKPVQLTLFAGGALAVQVWHYFEQFGKRGEDKIRIQFTVAVLILFSIFQNASLVHRIYDIHVRHFGNFAFPLLTVGWEVACSFVCISLMNGLTQMYYAHRVWVALHKVSRDDEIQRPRIDFMILSAVYTLPW